jgi:hypothetical protein
MMALNNGFGDRQTQPRPIPIMVTRFFSPPEPLKNMGQVCGRNADAGILHSDHSRFPGLLQGNGNGTPGGGVL